MGSFARCRILGLQFPPPPPRSNLNKLFSCLPVLWFLMEKSAVNVIKDPFNVKSFLSCCFQDSVFVFIFEQFDHDVSGIGLFEFILLELYGAFWIRLMFLLNFF